MRQNLENEKPEYGSLKDFLAKNQIPDDKWSSGPDLYEKPADIPADISIHPSQISSKFTINFGQTPHTIANYYREMSRSFASHVNHQDQGQNLSQLTKDADYVIPFP